MGPLVNPDEVGRNAKVIAINGDYRKPLHTGSFHWRTRMVNTRTKRGWGVVLAGALTTLAVGAQTGPINIDAGLNHWNGTYVGQVTRHLPAGDYLLYYKGTADNALGASDYLYDAWSCCQGGGWVNQYFVQTSAGTTFVGTIENGNWKQFGDAASALAVAKATLSPLALHLAQAEKVSFGIADAPGMYGDNGGGISLLIAGAVPEPSTHALWLLGLACGVTAYRSRRR
jgi:hypothetical protein